MYTLYHMLTGFVQLTPSAITNRELAVGIVIWGVLMFGLMTWATTGGRR